MASYSATPSHRSLQSLEKIRASLDPRTSTPYLGKGALVGASSDTIGKYRQEAIASRRVGGALLAAAVKLARNNGNIALEYDPSGKTAMLYEIRVAHGGSYEDVEDGFTEDRTNYDETTVTLQALAEQVKTLKRDLQRSGIL